MVKLQQPFHKLDYIHALSYSRTHLQSLDCSRSVHISVAEGSRSHTDHTSPSSWSQTRQRMHCQWLCKEWYFNK